MTDEVPAETPETTGSPSVSPTPSPSETTTPAPSPYHIHPRPWGDRWIGEPSIDRDASMVAFTVGGDYPMAGEQPKFFSQVYVRSRASHTTSLISRSLSGGEGNENSSDPAVSADGKRIAFASMASNLVESDTNGVADVFVRDLVRHMTRRVSVSTEGRQGDAPSGAWLVRGEGRLYGGTPTISTDGRYVAFTSVASNLVTADDNDADDVFVHDLETGKTIAVSVTREGTTGNGASDHPSMSADGSLVAFQTRATDLASGQNNGGSLSDVVVRDVTKGETALVSLSPEGDRFDGLNGSPGISPSGRHIAFVHQIDFGDGHTPPIDNEGGSLFRRDLAAGKTVVDVDCHHCRRVTLSEDGSAFVYVDAIGGMDQFCYVAEPGYERHEGYLGACGPGIDISWDGRYAAFSAGIDALSDPKDEEKFGGPGGAMIYDRETDRYTPAWLI